MPAIGGGYSHMRLALFALMTCAPESDPGSLAFELGQ